MSLNKLTSTSCPYLTPNVGSISVNPKAAVTQLTNINTGVTINSSVGAITSVSNPGIAAGISQAFTVTNSLVTTSSYILLTPNFAGNSGVGTGVPVVSVTNIASGSFQITVSNANGSTALALPVTIYFLVI